MKYALIGCGSIASKHLKAAMDSNLEIAAVCDMNEKRVGSLLKSCDLGHTTEIEYYSDAALMLERVKPDIVSIATGSGSHAKLALDCIEHGTHVIIEKPIALNIIEADKIVTRAREKNIKVAVCHQNRFSAAVQKVRCALEQGRFGKMSHGSVHVRWNRNQEYYQQSPWRGTWAQDGGTLMNQCIHAIDLLCWMLGGEPETVYAQTRRQFHPYIEAEDLGLALVSFKNGAIAAIEGTTNVYPRNLEETLYLFGENGTVKLSGKSMSDIEVWNFADGSKPSDIDTIGDDIACGKGHASLFIDMIEAIEKDRPPYVDARAGRNALALILAIYKSSATGKPVGLPLVTGSTVEFSQSF